MYTGGKDKGDSGIVSIEYEVYRSDIPCFENSFQGGCQQGGQGIILHICGVVGQAVGIAEV